MSSARAKSGSSCLACRTRKVRCLDNEDQTVPCRRCAQLRISCLYQPLGRSGRPSTASRMATSLADPRPPSPVGVQSTAQISQDPPSNSSPRVTSATAGDAAHGTSPVTFSAQSSYTQGRLWAAIESGSKSVARPSGSAADLLDPGAPSLTTAGTSTDLGGLGSGRQFGDPVTVSLLSTGEAAQLVALFHAQLNQYIKLLDPNLHDIGYLRAHSTVLFSAVLFASSKIFRKDLFPSLESHFRSLLNRCVNEATCDLGVVQSLMIAVFWKAPTDPSAWLKLGMAVRLAYQLRLHQPRKREPLPSDMLEARKVADGERTWLCLFLFDRNEIYDLPWSIRRTELPDPAAWCLEVERLGNPIDRAIAALHPVTHIRDELRAARSSHSESPSYRQALCEDLSRRVNGLLAQLPIVDDPTSHAAVALGRRWLLLHTLFCIQAFEAEAQGATPPAGSIETASRIVDTVDEMAWAGGLQVWHDIASINISTLCLYLWKNYPALGPSFQELVRIMIQRLNSCTSKLSQHEPLSAPAYVARFTQRLLDSLQSRSRPATAPVSPTPVEPNAMADFGPDDDWSLALDELLGTGHTVSGTQSVDADYWLSFFPGTPALGML